MINIKGMPMTWFDYPLRHIRDIFMAYSFRERSGTIYYPPEVRRGEYWMLGVFLLQYLLLVSICKYCIIIAQI